MGRLIIGDIMKKSKKTKKVFFIKGKYFYLFSLLVLLIFSYFEMSNGIYVTGYLKDVLFYPTRMIADTSFVEEVDAEIKSENDELRKILSVGRSLTDYEPIYATVVERNSSYWFNALTINKGSYDGITEGMAVVDYSGLVGNIEKVSFGTSIVKLITSNQKYNNISVKINSKESINKILTVSNNNLVIAGINKNSDILIGDSVVTNGLSNKFPSGILVGKITSLESDSYNVSNIAYVEPVANLENVRFVAVLKR